MIKTPAQLVAAYCAIGLTLVGCPLPYAVELKQTTRLMEPEFITLNYFKKVGAFTPDCVGDRISDFRPDVDFIDRKEFWHAAFPRPAPSTSLSRLLEDSALRNRVAHYDLDYLVTVHSDYSLHEHGHIPPPIGARWGRWKFYVSAELWNWQNGSLTKRARAEGSGPTAKAVLVFVPLYFGAYGAAASTCETVAQEIVEHIERRPGAVRVAVLGTGDSGVVPPVGGWAVKELSTKAKNPGSEAFYTLATHLHVSADVHEDWVAETLYRVGTAPGGYSATGFMSSEKWTWLCRAAHRNHPRAQMTMGDYYRSGTDPVSPDAVKSYMWHALAAANGSDSAARRVTEYRFRLAADQIAEGEQLASEWKPDPAKCAASIER